MYCLKGIWVFECVYVLGMEVDYVIVGVSYFMVDGLLLYGDIVLGWLVGKIDVVVFGCDL